MKKFLLWLAPLLVLGSSFAGCSYANVKEDFETKIRPVGAAVIVTAKAVNSIAEVVDSVADPHPYK